MRILKSRSHVLRGRFEESLLIAESVLKQEPEHTSALSIKAYGLLKLLRPTTSPLFDRLRLAGVRD